MVAKEYSRNVFPPGAEKGDTEVANIYEGNRGVETVPLPGLTKDMCSGYVLKALKVNGKCWMESRMRLTDLSKSWGRD